MFADQDCSCAFLTRPLIQIKRGFCFFWVLFHVVATVSGVTMARATIAYLEQRYTALEKEIADALRQSPTDDLAIADLTYRKLIIADEIQHRSSMGRAFRQARRKRRSAACEGQRNYARADDGSPTRVRDQGRCSSSGERIYHVPGQRYETARP